MNYFLLFLTGLIAFTWGIVFAFYLIFVCASLRIFHILAPILCEDISKKKACETLNQIINQPYQFMKYKEDNEDT